MYKEYYTLADLCNIISSWHELLVYTDSPSGSLLAVHFPADCVHLHDNQGAMALFLQDNGNMLYLKEPLHDFGRNYRFYCTVTDGEGQKKIEVPDGANVITMILRR